MLTWFENKLVPVFHKFGRNRYMIAMRNGMAFVIPITIIGSLFSILANFPIAGWSDFLGDFKPVLELPSKATLWFLSIVVVGSVAYAAAKEFKTDFMSSIVISEIAFIMTQMRLDGSLNTMNFGAGGIFLAILISLFTVKTFEFFHKKGLKLNLPKSIPPMVADSLQAIVPGFIVVFVFWIITFVFKFDMIVALDRILSPFVHGLDSLWGILIVVFITVLLWCAGINGESIMSGLTIPVFMSMYSENAAAFAAGDPIPNITAYGFYNFGIWFGGGCTIMLALLMMRSKSKTYQSLGKLCFGPCLFGIAEPILFGFPIILNPVMMIPMIIFPLVAFASTYLLMYFNIIGRVVAMVPFGTPPVISGFLCTGGDWRAALWQVILLGIGLCIYYPFFKIEEKRTLKEESELLQMEENA